MSAKRVRRLVTLPRQTGPDGKIEHHLEEGALSTWHRLRLVLTIFSPCQRPEAHKSTSKLASGWVRVACIKVALAQVDSAPADKPKKESGNCVECKSAARH